MIVSFADVKYPIKGTLILHCSEAKKKIYIYILCTECVRSAVLEFKEAWQLFFYKSKLDLPFHVLRSLNKMAVGKNRRLESPLLS
jgi:hypothetical protein